MERKLTLTEQVNNLELANKALRNYANELEKKLARYEHVLQCCPRFRMEKQAEMEQAAPAYIESRPGQAYEDYYYDEEEAYFDALAEADEDEFIGLEDLDDDAGEENMYDAYEWEDWEDFQEFES
jgi:hypothetical protein